jgi:hypothetical protein
VERWIKPYPFAPLNHLTTPFSFKRTPFQPRLTIVSTLGTLRVAAKCVQQIRFTWML